MLPMHDIRRSISTVYLLLFSPLQIYFFHIRDNLPIIQRLWRMAMSNYPVQRDIILWPIILWSENEIN